MKPIYFVLFLLWSISPVTAPGLQAGAPPPEAASELAAWAASLLSNVRSNIVSELRGATRADTTEVANLEAVLQALTRASNDVACAGVKKRLAAASEQIGVRAAKAASKLQDPANQAMAHALDPEKWQRDALIQASRADVLDGEVARLRATLVELLDYAREMSGLPNRQELGKALKARVSLLLAGWEGVAPAPKPAPEQSAARAVQKPDSRTAAPPIHPLALPPAIESVTRLVRAGVAEPVVVQYVHTQAQPFGPTVEQMIYLHDIGVPSSVIAAMVQQDALLRQNGGGP